MPQQPLAITVGLIGLGQMARALAEGWSGQFDPPPTLVGFDPDEQACREARQRVPALQLAANETEVAMKAEVVVLAVKPHVVPAVAGRIACFVGNRSRLVASIAAGVRLGELQRALSSDRIIRIMPNTPCLVGAGAAGMAAAAGAASEDRELVERLVSAVARCHWLDEELLDAVTGLSGSGPAYVFLLIEALADGGVRMGLPRDVALSLATQTMLGSAKLLLAQSCHPAELKDRVASPGGTTMAGLEALERHGVRAGMMAAVGAATRRAAELRESVDP